MPPKYLHPLFLVLRIDKTSRLTRVQIKFSVVQDVALSNSQDREQLRVHSNFNEPTTLRFMAVSSRVMEVCFFSVAEAIKTKTPDVSDRLLTTRKDVGTTE